jgi:hypothetical protein
MELKRMSMFKEKREMITKKLITPPLPLYDKEFPLIFFGVQNVDVLHL